MDQNQSESISRPAAAAIAGLAANYFVSNGRRTGNSAEENALWLKYVTDCADRGASPYGANRHYRRAAASQRRHAEGEQRRQAQTPNGKALAAKALAKAKFHDAVRAFDDGARVMLPPGAEITQVAR